MQIETMRPGQRYTLDVNDIETGAPKKVALTVIQTGWYFSPVPQSHVIYHGALVVFDQGIVEILDFMTLEFCRPFLCLPAPA
jgi:hypothetical protein